MTGSRFVNGSMTIHEELGEKLATFFGRESALVFTTGYQVNLALGSARLGHEGAVAVIDRSSHTSIYDGVRLGLASGGRMIRFKHNSASSLDRVLGKLRAGEAALVITDGVFSAEGEIASLDELLPLVRRHGARIFVDDARGLGVIGPGGRGTAHHFGLENEVDLIGGTFSKSLAILGGVLVGDRKVLDYIKHFAPSFMFAASGPPSCVAAAMSALEVLQEETWRIKALRRKYTYMRDELAGIGFELGSTETAVIPIYVRDDALTLEFWRVLFEEHSVYANPFISPGVQPRNSLLRTSYVATHEAEHLDRGLDAFRSAGRKLGLI
jgi:8-amino-7-oxononanoate synthase